MGRVVFALAAALVIAGDAAARQSLATHTLTGKVTDASGQPLPGVSVELRRPTESSTVQSVVTNRSGTYTVDRVLPGTYVLTFRLPGFSPAIRDIEIGGGPPLFEYHVQLTPTFEGTVTVPGPTLPARRVVCGMTVITPPADVDPGIRREMTPPAGGTPVKPTIRAIQPTLCWEP